MEQLPLYEKHPPLKNNYPLKLIKCNARNGLHAHWHEHMELHFYLSSGFKIMCDNRLIEVEENDLVVVNRGQVHFSDVEMEASYYCIIINPQFFKDLEVKNPEIENLIRNDSTVKGYIEAIIREYFKADEGWDMAVKGEVYNLLTYLFRNYKKTVEGSEVKVRKSHKKRMSEIIDYISTHYEEKLTTRDLAEKFFMSEYYFCRHFKTTMGQTPVEYINRYRIEKAVTLLEEKERAIGEIATMVGFDDQNYFSRIFKKVTGKTPVEYRRGM